MQVFVLTKPSSRLKGFLSKVGIAAATNVYVSTLNKREANMIWEEIVLRYEPKGALVIQSEPNDPWFSIRTYGSLVSTVTELDGLPVRIKPK